MLGAVKSHLCTNGSQHLFATNLGKHSKQSEQIHLVAAEKTKPANSRDTDERVWPEGQGGITLQQSKIEQYQHGLHGCYHLLGNVVIYGIYYLQLHSEGTCYLH